MDSSTGECIQTFENVSNFIEAAGQFITEVFCARDLEDCGERPQVRGRLLWTLKLCACCGLAACWHLCTQMWRV